MPGQSEATSLPGVSVVIPTYNSARFLADAVTSVLEQGYPRLEILIVDDGSTDDTRQLAVSMGPAVRYLYQDNQGPPAARNLGLRSITGDLVALLDADDLWTPGKLALQVPPLMSNPDLGMVLGLTQYFRTNEQTGEEERLRPFFVVQLGCGLFRSEVFRTVGGFDETLRYGDDVDWFMRTREQGIGAVLLDRATVRYRRHSDNMTIADGHQGPTQAETLKRSLDRRRKTGKLLLPPWPPRPVSPPAEGERPFWKR